MTLCRNLPAKDPGMPGFAWQAHWRKARRSIGEKVQLTDARPPSGRMSPVAKDVAPVARSRLTHVWWHALRQRTMARTRPACQNTIWKQSSSKSEQACLLKLRVTIFVKPFFVQNWGSHFAENGENKWAKSFAKIWESAMYAALVLWLL